MSSSEKYLITGGAGFIGSHLANLLAREGLYVSVYDNFSVGKREFLASQVNIVVGDILDRALLSETLRRVGADRVIHLAALHFIPYCNAHPEETLHTNVEGTYSVLRACADAGVNQVVLASSGALYRDQAGLIREEDALAANDVYGLSKLMMESCADFFARHHSLNLIVARLFNTYGPHETQDHLIPAIVRQLKLGARLTLGNVETKRDYVFVEDVARALFACANLNDTRFATVNVGTGVEYSAREIVDHIGAILGKPLEIVHSPELFRRSDKLHQAASFARLKELTGWEPQANLSEGLHKLLHFEGLV